MEVDAMGNVLIFKKGKKAPQKPVLLAAHMDEVGLIIKRIGDEGMLQFGFVGGVDRRIAIGRRVLIGKNRKLGVIGIKAVHLTKAEERKTAPKADELYIDIGASSKEEALLSVSPGDYGVFDSAFLPLAGDRFKARAIDDRAGCAVLLSLLAEELPVDTWFAFTTQEEVGCRGAHAVAYGIQPGRVLVVETTTAADLPEVEDHLKVCSLGRGAVISFMDRGTIYPPSDFRRFTTAADRAGIPWQTKTVVAGGNDASIFHKALGGARTLNVSIPVRYLHSPASVASLADCEGALALTRLFLREFGDDENV